MTAVPKKKKLTEEEHPAIERAAEFKSEFYDGEMFAMAGASYPNNRIKGNLVIEIGSRLIGSDCQVLSSDMREKIPRTRSNCYPDVAIVCGEPEFADDKKDTLLNPRVLFEILSPSTESFDRGGKFQRYQKLESLKEYPRIAGSDASSRSLKNS